MSTQPQISKVSDFVERLAQTAGGQPQISIAEMLTAAGRRSFGALLLVPGLIVLSPLSGIPGLPTTFAVLVVLIAGQMLLGRDCFWLPRWVLCRHASTDRMQKVLRVLRPVARFADRLARPRLKPMVHGPAVYLIAICCILIAATMPPLELFPFANSAAGAALSIFGLALISEDGLLATIAVGACVAGAIALAVRLI